MNPEQEQAFLRALWDASQNMQLAFRAYHDAIDDAARQRLERQLAQLSPEDRRRLEKLNVIPSVDDLAQARREVGENIASRAMFTLSDDIDARVKQFLTDEQFREYKKAYPLIAASAALLPLKAQ